MTKVKLGYLNAYEYLEHLVNKRKVSDKDWEQLELVLNDFRYTIEKTKKAEKIEEGLELLMEAQNNDLDDIPWGI